MSRILTKSQNIKSKKSEIPARKNNDEGVGEALGSCERHNEQE
jgi:hypothetical protein